MIDGSRYLTFKHSKTSLKQFNKLQKNKSSSVPCFRSVPRTCKYLYSEVSNPTATHFSLRVNPQIHSGDYYYFSK